MRNLVMATALVVIFGTAGCGSDSEQAREPTLGQIAQVRGASDLVLPLDAYEPTAEQQRTLSEAHDRLVRDCGRRFGFEVRTAATTDVVDSTDHQRRFGILLLSDATRYGYRVPAEAGAGQSGEASPTDTGSRQADGWNPSDDEFVAVRGQDRHTGRSKVGTVINGVEVPTGGCAGEAGRKLSEGVRGAPSPDLMTLPTTLANGAHTEAERDSRVRTAFKNWSGCMSRAGFQYGNPWQPNDHDWGPKVSPEEITTATADVKCRQETALVDLWLAVETAYQTRAIEKHRDELATAKRNFEQRLRNAEAVLEA